MKRKFLSGNLLLFIFSALFALIVMEVGLRNLINPNELYKWGSFDPIRLEKFNRYKFYSQYKNKPDCNLENYDPTLGWDYEINSQRIRGTKAYSIGKSEGVFRIMSIGDSFTYGNEVEDDETFSHFLEERIPNTEVLNMGTGGFGIGQTWLKYFHHGKNYHPDLVVLGIHPYMWDRTNVAFTAFSKPKHVLNADDSGLALENSPVTDPKKSLEEIEVQLDKEKSSISILIRELKMVLSYFKKEQYFDEMQRVIEKLLNTINQEVRSKESRLVIVQIPLGGRFEKTDSELHFAHFRLHKLYEKLNIPYIDLREEFLNRYNHQTIFDEFYIHRPDGSIGHLTKKGNQAVTKVIHQFLCKHSFTPPLDPSLSLMCN